MNALKKITLSLVALVAALPAIANAETLAIAKAAELACHRIERLVTLNKIDATFLSNFYSIQIVALPAGSPTDPAFKATGFLVPGPDNQGTKIDIMMDSKGKALAHTVVAGSLGQAPAWPVKDPVTLAENALHYVLDNGPSNADVAPFYADLQDVSLLQVKDSQNQVFAKALFRSSRTTKVLEVILKSDGTFVSAKFN